MLHITPLHSTPKIWRRFAGKVDARGECWIWAGCVDGSGYGVFFVDSVRKSVRAHRFAFEQVAGPIPDGLVIDHTCSIRNCVNPAHLEAVTVAENNKRRGDRISTCPRGHNYSPENTYRNRQGGKSCRTCKRSRDQRRREGLPPIGKDNPMSQEPLGVSVKDAASMTSFSEFEIRDAINHNEMTVVRRGRRISIPVDELNKWYRAQLAEPA